MQQPKTKRPDAPPSGLDDPFPHHLKSIREIDLRSIGGFVGRYRKFPRAWLAEAPDTIYKRRVFCWLFHDDVLIGAFELIDFTLPDLAFVDDDEFYVLMDSVSDSAMVLADALVRTWPGVSTSIFLYGNVVLLDRAWVKPGLARRSEWAAVLRRLIEIEYRRYSVIALKAFPLEYENREDQTNFKRRRRALIRLYSRELGMRPFPGGLGEDGWLYAFAPRLEGFLRHPK